MKSDRLNKTLADLKKKDEYPYNARIYVHLCQYFQRSALVLLILEISDLLFDSNRQKKEKTWLTIIAFTTNMI